MGVLGYEKHVLGRRVVDNMPRVFQGKARVNYNRPRGRFQNSRAIDNISRVFQEMPRGSEINSRVIDIDSRVFHCSPRAGVRGRRANG